MNWCKWKTLLTNDWTSNENRQVISLKRLIQSNSFSVACFFFLPFLNSVDSNHHPWAICRLQLQRKALISEILYVHTAEASVSSRVWLAITTKSRMLVPDSDISTWNVFFDSTRCVIKITNDSQPKGDENPFNISSATTSFSYQVSHCQATRVKPNGKEEAIFGCYYSCHVSHQKSSGKMRQKSCHLSRNAQKNKNKKVQQWGEQIKCLFFFLGKTSTSGD